MDIAPEFDIEHRSLVTNAVISSVAFLEAAINEVLKDAADRHHSYVGELDEEILHDLAALWEEAEGKGASHLRLLDKYQETLVRSKVERFDKGRTPYQDIHALIQLRNRLLHYKPESRSAGDRDRLDGFFRGRFPMNRLMEGTGNPFFPDKCLGAGCAEWAVTSVEAFADEFFGRLGVTPNYQRVGFVPKVSNEKRDTEDPVG